MSNAATGLGKVVADFQKRFPNSEAKEVIAFTLGYLEEHMKLEERLRLYGEYVKTEVLLTNKVCYQSPKQWLEDNPTI